MNSNFQDARHSILLAHPTGNSNVQHALAALHQAGILSAFSTCLHIPTDSVITRLTGSISLPSLRSLHKKLSRRCWIENSEAEIWTTPWPEIRRGMARLITTPFSSAHSRRYFQHQMDSVYAALDAATARRLSESSTPFSAVWCYEDAALETFRVARQRGITTIYELPIPYYKCREAILQETAATHPFLKSSGELRSEVKAKQERKDQELALADVVVVPSEFARQSLELFTETVSKIVVLPYGAPKREAPVQHLQSEQKVIFAGHVNIRKGAHLLFDAWDSLKTTSASLDCFGKVFFDQQTLKHWALEGVTLHGGIPFEDLQREYQNASVMAFPTLCDGFGLTMLEAMSFGVPVIATRNCGGPEIIEHERNGLLIPANDSSALADALRWCLEDGDRLEAMRHAAKATAQKWSWERYHHGVNNMIENQLPAR